MNFMRLISILRARWKIVSMIFLASVLSAIIVTIVMPKQYIATASVLVDAKSDPIAGTVNPDQLSAGYLLTQLDIITSERVAERVVRTLKLDDVSDFRRQWEKATDGRGSVTAWLAGNLRKSVSVTPSRDSNVINIDFKWPNAKAAAPLANAFAKAYIDTTIDLKVEPAKQYASWFDERSKELRADLADKQKRLSEFQKSSQITATDTRLDIETSRLAELSSQLTAIQAQRQDSESHQHRVNGDNQALPEVLQSPVIGGLKSNLAVAEAKLENIAVTLGKNHPEYQNTEAEIGSLRERIRQETTKVAASLGKITQTNLQRENEIKVALEDQKRRVLELKHEHDELDVLQNDVLTAQHTLDSVSQRLAQNSLESQMQQTNVILLAGAIEPLTTSSPKVVLNIFVGILIGLLFGGGVAVILELMSPRIRSVRDVEELTATPVLANFNLPRASVRIDRQSRPALALVDSSVE